MLVKFYSSSLSYISSYQTENPRVLKFPFERHKKHLSGSEGLEEEEDKG
jgi:hypothetical protein